QATRAGGGRDQGGRARPARHRRREDRKVHSENVNITLPLAPSGHGMVDVDIVLKSGQGGFVAGGGRKARPAVISDVARLAGVSNQTVSRVLNDHPNVRSGTRERVLEAMKRLDYTPNLMARGLVRQRSHMIGVVSFDAVLFGPAATLLGIGRGGAAHRCRRPARPP